MLKQFQDADTAAATVQESQLKAESATTNYVQTLAEIANKVAREKNAERRIVFAAQFMAALITSPATDDDTFQDMAKKAVEAADDLIAELEKK